MNLATDLDAAVLHSLRIKGRCQPAGIATAVAADEAAVRQVLAQAAADGLVAQSTGRLAGWLLTPAGRQRWDELAATIRAGNDIGTLADLYEVRFLGLNRRFKRLCTHSQLSAGAAITVEFEEIHRATIDLLDEFGSVLPGLARYRPRFNAAMERYRAGASSALLQPLTGSYHDIWMELHEDLLLLLGKVRDEDD